MKNLFLFFLVSIFILTGCRATVKTMNPDKEVYYDETYGHTDLHKLADAISKSILKKSAAVRSGEKPVIIIYGIVNRTMEHIDTKSITDAIRTKLFDSKKVKFVNKVQRENIIKEMEYQSKGFMDSATMIEKGKQIGAEYMLTGTLVSIEKKQMRQVRLKKKKLQYYKLTMELTDLNTALIEWTDEHEIVKEASRPFIGW